MPLVPSDESLNLQTAVSALSLAEEMDFYYTKPREQELPPTVLAALKQYRTRRDRVPLPPEPKPRFEYSTKG